MIKKIISGLLTFCLTITCLTSSHVNAETISIIKLDPFSELYGNDLSAFDLRDKEDLLTTITFSSKTKWPASDKLPKNFNPKKLLEFGKDPGLGVGELHKLGYTGKGVNIAYIDQSLLPNHIEYKDNNIRYYKIRPKTQGMESSMHGPAVLSLLAGKDIGIAPESKVYFFGHPAWLRDQTTHAEALRKLIDVNKTLTSENKIRIVGFSDAADPSEKNIEEFQRAIKETEDSGIMVFDVTTINIVPLTVKAFKDKNDPNSYEPAQWAKNFSISTDSLCVPSSGRTTAVGNSSDSTEYMYWTNGGLSWTIPYIVGTVALGLQIDSTLTKANAIKYLKESAFSYKGGGIINPKGFLQLVEKNCVNKKFKIKLGDSDYSYVLYNSRSVDTSDLSAMQTYYGSFGPKKQMLLKDVSSCSNAVQIYKTLKEDWLSRKGNLKGIQIIGTSSDVPAFDIHFKVQMANEIDDSGFFKSDFFYSTFKNIEATLQNDFSIYKNFKEGLNVSFIPEWPVVRLPLSRGEVAGFIKKYMDYTQRVTKLDFVPLVNFSNPIFSQKEHSDDMGYFITERLDKEFSILNNTQYRLYGNKQGFYPVTTNVMGDYTKANIKSENEQGIVDFFINSHGQENNIDQAIFENKDKSSEKRISFLNSKDINKVLLKNYYTLTTWTCLNAFGLNSNNLLHEALAKGTCVNAMGATSIISNNGVNNKASFDTMKKNNFYYFQYRFFDSLMDGYSRSESFFLAQKAYAEEILKNTNMLIEGNYQFNLHNILSYHNLGLLENWNPKHSELKMIGTNTQVIKGDTNISNTNLSSGNVTYSSNIVAKDLKVNKVKYEKSGSDILFTFEVESGKTRGYSFFNPPDGSLFKLFNMNSGIKKGKNTIKFKVPIKKIKEFSHMTFMFIDSGDNSNYLSFSTDQLSY